MKTDTKKSIIKTFVFFVMVISVAFLIYSLIYHQYLKSDWSKDNSNSELSLSTKIKEKGYMWAFISSFLLDGTPQFIAADISLITGGLIGLNILFVFIFVSLGSILVSIIMYFVGYMKGENIAKLFVEQEKYEESVELFEKKGKFAMTIMALIYTPYLPILAGALKMHFYDFLIYGVLMRLIRFGIVSYILFVLIY